MKNLMYCAGLLAALTGTAHAGSQDFAGSYSGEEHLVVSQCVNDRQTAKWDATFVVEGDKYTGKGSSRTGGDFTFAGDLSDTTASGTVEGRTPEGRLWEGKTEATLLPGGELVMKINGKVPMVGCVIVVDIKAAKTGT